MNTPDAKMSAILGLLFVICVTVVGLRLAVVKSLDWKSLSSLLLFGLFAGFVIARYDQISWLGISKDVGVKTFQDRINAIASETIAGIQKEIGEQKESLKLVIADANTTREKLSKQTENLEKLYEKTATLESKLDIQREKIEAAATKADHATARLNEAKQVLDKLSIATTTAVEKLALLDHKTSGIESLPDGRTKIGTFVAGSPHLVEREANNMWAAIQANDWLRAHDLAASTIKMIEDTETETKGSGLTAGSMNPEWLAEVYRMASDCARIAKKPYASRWAKKSIEHRDSGSGRAAHVVSLAAENRHAEADAAIKDALTKTGPIADEFREVMRRLGFQLPP